MRTNNHTVASDKTAQIGGKSTINAKLIRKSQGKIITAYTWATNGKGKVRQKKVNMGGKTATVNACLSPYFPERKLNGISHAHTRENNVCTAQLHSVPRHNMLLKNFDILDLRKILRRGKNN